MDISDVFVALGITALILGLTLVHPALVLALVGYAALTYGMNRSR